MKNIKLKNYLLLTNDEHQKLLEIRNSDEIRSFSLDDKTITLNEHLSWVEKLEDDDTKEYFAVIYNDAIIGGVSVFDKRIKWGVFFDSKTSLMIKSIVPIYFIDYLFDNYRYQKLFAEIKKDNINAISYNKNLGFEVLEENNVVVMQLNKNNYIKVKHGVILKKIIKKMNLYNFKMEKK